MGAHFGLGLTLVVASLSLACSGSSSTAHDGSGGVAGTTAGGGSGTGTGGGSAGNAGSPPGQCAPGATYKAENQYDNHLYVCYQFTSDLPDWSTEPSADVRQLDLTDGMTAGKPYVLSVQMGATAGQTFEIWGAGTGSSGTCRNASERLYQGPAQTGALCVTLQPKQDHQSVLMVVTGPSEEGYGYASFTECSTGSCPQ